MKNYLLAFVVMLPLALSAQTTYEDYTYWSSDNSRVIVNIGKAAADGYSSMTVYAVNDGNATEKGITYTREIHAVDGESTSVLYGSDWSQFREGTFDFDAPKVIYRRTTINTWVGQNYISTGNETIGAGSD